MIKITWTEVRGTRNKKDRAFFKNTESALKFIGWLEKEKDITDVQLIGGIKIKDIK